MVLPEGGTNGVGHKRIITEMTAKRYRTASPGFTKIQFNGGAQGRTRSVLLDSE
jgi:hypothetical protein